MMPCLPLFFFFFLFFFSVTPIHYCTEHIYRVPGRLVLVGYIKLFIICIFLFLKKSMSG